MEAGEVNVVDEDTGGEEEEERLLLVVVFTDEGSITDEFVSWDKATDGFDEDIPVPVRTEGIVNVGGIVGTEDDDVYEEGTVVVVVTGSSIVR